jgi:death-on-curing protein
MEDPSGQVVFYPTIEQICQVNRRMIQEFGGLFIPPDNLLNENPLEYVLDAVRYPIDGLGLYLYPTLKERASAIACRIISGHVFNDGNKRTATHVAWMFLRSNGIPLFLDPTIIDLTEAVAKGEASHDHLLKWLHDHQET